MPKGPNITNLQNIFNSLRLVMCWLSCVIGIISFICQSKTITNDYFHLTNKSRDPVSGNDNFLLLVTLGIYLFDWLFKY